MTLMPASGNSFALVTRRAPLSWRWRRADRPDRRLAPAPDRVGEVDALHHVVLRHDVFAFEQPGLADPELRRDIDHEAILESGHLLAHEIDQRIDALAALEVGAGQVLDFQSIIAGHV